MVPGEEETDMIKSSQETASLIHIHRPVERYETMPQMHSLRLERFVFPKKHFTQEFISP